MENNSICPNLGMIANGNGTDDFCPSSNIHMPTNSNPCHNGHLLQKRAVTTNVSFGMNHNPIGMNQ